MLFRLQQQNTAYGSGCEYGARGAVKAVVWARGESSALWAGEGGAGAKRVRCYASAFTRYRRVFAPYFF